MTCTLGLSPNGNAGINTLDASRLRTSRKSNAGDWFEDASPRLFTTATKKRVR